MALSNGARSRRGRLSWLAGALAACGLLIGPALAQEDEPDPWASTPAPAPAEQPGWFEPHQGFDEPPGDVGPPPAASYPTISAPACDESTLQQWQQLLDRCEAMSQQNCADFRQKVVSCPAP